MSSCWGGARWLCGYMVSVWSLCFRATAVMELICSHSATPASSHSCRHASSANTGLSTESSFQAQGCLVVCPDHLFPTLLGSSLLQGLRLHANSLMATGRDFCSTSAPCWLRHLHCSCTSKAPSLSVGLFRSWSCPELPGAPAGPEQLEHLKERWTELGSTIQAE